MRRIGPGLVALIVATMALASPASAADMAPAPGYYPPQQAYPPAIYDWTGLYFGGHLGAGMLEDTYTQGATTPLLANGTTTNVHPLGVLGGGQIGVNYEFAPWVIGAEGSYTVSGINNNNTATSLEPATGVRMTSAPRWLAAATVRAGYAANTLLFYVKGGAAWMHVDYTEDILVGGVTFSTSRLMQNRAGFVVGGGLEYGMTENLSAKLEYDFYDFGSANYTFNVGDPGAGGAPVAMPASIKSDINVLTVGLNYRFTWSGSNPFR